MILPLAFGLILGDSDGVWTDDVRVGEVGGNTLGFFGCQIISKDHLVGYSFNGALHSWILRYVANTGQISTTHLTGL